MSISLPFTTLDVFTTTRYEGNPLAVVHIPTDPKKQPSSDQLDQIAKEFNLSETIFIYLRDESTDNGNDEVPEWKVRIYTIEGEIPFAGMYITNSLLSLNAIGHHTRSRIDTDEDIRPSEQPFTALQPFIHQPRPQASRSKAGSSLPLVPSIYPTTQPQELLPPTSLTTSTFTPRSLPRSMTSTSSSRR